jgi:hypothetical protein
VAQTSISSLTVTAVNADGHRRLAIFRSTENAFFAEPEALGQPARAALHQTRTPKMPEDKGPATRPFLRYTRRSVAAPPAGLHFTPGISEKIRARGRRASASVTLARRRRNFSPVKAENIARTRCTPSAMKVARRHRCRRRRGAQKSGQRVVAVGTTAARTLETAARR